MTSTFTNLNAHYFARYNQYFYYYDFSVILDLIENGSCNCVNFSKPNDKDDLFIKISCDSKHLIGEIFVYSEVK